MVGWLLRHPHRIRPLVGTVVPQRIVACAQAPRAAVLMTHEDWYALWTAARGQPLPWPRFRTAARAPGHPRSRDLTHSRRCGGVTEQ